MARSKQNSERHTRDVRQHTKNIQNHTVPKIHIQKHILKKNMKSETKRLDFLETDVYFVCSGGAAPAIEELSG